MSAAALTARFQSVLFDKENTPVFEKGYTIQKQKAGEYDCFNVKAEHPAQEVIDKFYELVEWRLKEVFGILPMDGDDENLLLIWRCSTAATWKVNDMKKAIKLIWDLVTMFEE